MKLMNKRLIAIACLGVVHASLFGCANSSRSLVLETSAPAATGSKTLTVAEQCEATTSFSSISAKDWIGGKIPLDWSASAASECFGAGLPAIRVNDARVSAYVQVVEMNGPANTDAHWAMNLNPSDTSQQYYLDVSPEARERMWPFYNLEYGPKIFINPDFDPPLSLRRWKAPRYGLALDQKTGPLPPILGLQCVF